MQLKLRFLPRPQEMGTRFSCYYYCLPVCPSPLVRDVQTSSQQTLMYGWANNPSMMMKTVMQIIMGNMMRLRRIFVMRTMRRNMMSIIMKIIMRNFIRTILKIMQRIMRSIIMTIKMTNYYYKYDERLMFIVIRNLWNLLWYVLWLIWWELWCKYDDNFNEN